MAVWKPKIQYLIDWSDVGLANLYLSDYTDIADYVSAINFGHGFGVLNDYDNFSVSLLDGSISLSKPLSHVPASQRKKHHNFYLYIDDRPVLHC